MIRADGIGIDWPARHARLRVYLSQRLIEWWVLALALCSWSEQGPRLSRSDIRVAYF